MLFKISKRALTKACLLKSQVLGGLDYIDTQCFLVVQKMYLVIPQN